MMLFFLFSFCLCVFKTDFFLKVQTLHTKHEHGSCDSPHTNRLWDLHTPLPFYVTGVLPACISVYHEHAWNPRKPQQLCPPNTRMVKLENTSSCCSFRWCSHRKTEGVWTLTFWVNFPEVTKTLGCPPGEENKGQSRRSPVHLSRGVGITADMQSHALNN